MYPDDVPLRCAPAAEQRQDPVFATAPPAQRWLLIESPAPWPRQALNALQTEPSELSSLCAAAGIRPVLIRRHGRQAPTPPRNGAQAPATPRDDHQTPATPRRDGGQDPAAPRRWAMVDCRPGQESIRWGILPTDDHLLDVLTGTDPGTPSTEPIYLVCTHGRHDACCAIRGRPAAAALSAAFPDRTWECSHIGGDRFAANLVFLPHSLFYGHVPTTEAVALATRYNEGFVVPRYLRGSGAHPPPVQAAQHFARESGASLAVDALHQARVSRHSPTTWRIRLAADPAPYVVDLTATTITINASMTCATQPPGQVTTFRRLAAHDQRQTDAE